MNIDAVLRLCIDVQRRRRITRVLVRSDVSTTIVPKNISDDDGPQPPLPANIRPGMFAQDGDGEFDDFEEEEEEDDELDDDDEEEMDDDFEDDEWEEVEDDDPDEDDDDDWDDEEKEEDKKD